MANKTAIFFKKGKFGTSGHHIVFVQKISITLLSQTFFWGGWGWNQQTLAPSNPLEVPVFSWCFSLQILNFDTTSPLEFQVILHGVGISGYFLGFTRCRSRMTVTLLFVNEIVENCIESCNCNQVALNKLYFVMANVGCSFGTVSLTYKIILVYC